jgi:glycosidase
LSAVIKAFRYWIALTDCDGFRIDTVKHVSLDASRNFCGAIHEFAESLGKETFLLLGEVTGGSQVSKDYLEVFGRNIDAVLDIGDPAKRLASMVKGWEHPKSVFS